MKGRDIEALIRNRGFEKAMTHIARELLERQNQLARDLTEMAMLQSRMIDAMQVHTHEIKSTQDRVKRLKNFGNEEDMTDVDTDYD